MGSIAAQLERPDQAETYFREAIERVTRTLGEDHPYFIPPVQSLGDLLVEQGRFSDAVELLSGAEAACRRKNAIRDDGALARLLGNLGIARTATKDFAAAERNLQEAYQMFIDGMGPTSFRVRQTASALVDLYTAWQVVDGEADYTGRIAEWNQKVLEATQNPFPVDAP